MARIFLDIAGLLERKKENHFKIRAYRQAAQRIEELPVDIEQVVKEGRLREIPGVGEAIAKKMTELLTTGRLEFYEKLLSEAANRTRLEEEGQQQAVGGGK